MHAFTTRHAGKFVTFAFACLLPLVAAADIGTNLSYVDQSSVEYQRFKGWVDDAVAGDPGYAFSAVDAATMYKLTGQAQYAQLAVAIIEDQVVEAEAEIAAGDRPEVSGDQYLHVGDMIGALALTLDWCHNFTTLPQRNRWSAYAEQAVWNVWHHEQAEWGGVSHPWPGWSVDNPGNNYHYSFLKATAWWAYATDNTTWGNTWKNKLNNELMPALEQYFANIDGGGSQEGTGYGVSHARLFNVYRMWKDSSGVDLANANDHLSDSIAFWIHATVPTRDFLAPIGDQARVSQPEIYDYHRHMLLEARYLTNDAAARDDATWWLNNISVEQMQSGFNFLDDLLPAGTGGSPPSQLVYHAVDAAQLFARTDWTTNAMWLNFTAGPYVESHAHQDQGAFTLFADGAWVAVTANIWSHSGIHQEPEVHNVLRFIKNGQTVEQHLNTTSSMTVESTGPNGAVRATADLTPAYDGDPAVQSWKRTVSFGDRHLAVSDKFTLGTGTSAVFQVNTAVLPVINGDTVQIGNVTMRVIEPANPTISIKNWQADSEYNNGWRIDVKGGSSRYVVDFFDQEGIFSGGFE